MIEPQLRMYGGAMPKRICTAVPETFCVEHGRSPIGSGFEKVGGKNSIYSEEIASFYLFPKLKMSFLMMAENLDLI